MGMLLIIPIFVGIVFSISVLTSQFPLPFVRDAWWERWIANGCVLVLTIVCCAALMRENVDVVGFAEPLSQPGLWNAFLSVFLVAILPANCKFANVIRVWVKSWICRPDYLD